MGKWCDENLTVTSVDLSTGILSIFQYIFLTIRYRDKTWFNIYRYLRKKESIWKTLSTSYQNKDLFFDSEMYIIWFAIISSLER